MSDLQRLFVAAKIKAPWPTSYPEGRVLAEDARHMTLCFLGNCSYPSLKSILPFFPLPPFCIGPTGIADQLLFLPKQRPRVAAASAVWLDHKPIEEYQLELSNWFAAHGYRNEKRPFLPHITLARAPLEPQAWEKAFFPFPFFVEGIHLYQSKKNLTYTSLWELPLLPPFKDLDHTADLGFLIRGKTIQEIHYHAQIALSFHCQELLPYFSKTLETSLDAVIVSLNRMITQIDSELGSPFKAVSFHGDLHMDDQALLNWEMIVDV